MLQGKYINDPEVLREAGRAAGVEDYERALSDPSIALDQVRFWGSSFAEVLSSLPPKSLSYGSVALNWDFDSRTAHPLVCNAPPACATPIFCAAETARICAFAAEVPNSALMQHCTCDNT